MPRFNSRTKGHQITVIASKFKNKQKEVVLHKQNSLTKAVVDPESVYRFQGRLERLEMSTEGQQTLVRLRKFITSKRMKAEKVLGENTTIACPLLHSSLSLQFSSALESVYKTRRMFDLTCHFYVTFHVLNKLTEIICVFCFWWFFCLLSPTNQEAKAQVFMWTCRCQILHTVSYAG